LMKGFLCGKVKKFSSSDIKEELHLHILLKNYLESFEVPINSGIDSHSFSYCAQALVFKDCH